MGFVQGIAACYRCRQLFTFNPHRVPSVLVNGHREPVCQDCVNEVNPIRIANGIPPIVPLPGAYEPIPETDLILDGPDE